MAMVMTANAPRTDHSLIDWSHFGSPGNGSSGTPPMLIGRTSRSSTIRTRRVKKLMPRLGTRDKASQYVPGPEFLVPGFEIGDPTPCEAFSQGVFVFIAYVLFTPQGG